MEVEGGEKALYYLTGSSRTGILSSLGRGATLTGEQSAVQGGKRQGKRRGFLTGIFVPLYTCVSCWITLTCRC